MQGAFYFDRGTAEQPDSAWEPKSSEDYVIYGNTHFDASRAVKTSSENRSSNISLLPLIAF